MKYKFILSFMLMVLITPSICALDLSNKKLTKETLSLIYESELDLMRNEIFARKGYVFSNKKYQDYFESLSWYTPLNDNNSIVLSAVETYNIELLKQQSQKIALAKQKIKNYLKKVANNEIIIADLKFDLPLVNKMIANIDNINFCGDRGRYSVSSDNGYEEFSNSIYINLDVNFFQLSRYRYLSKDYPADARSENRIDTGDAGSDYLEGEKPLLEYLFYFDSDWHFTYDGYKFS